MSIDVPQRIPIARLAILLGCAILAFLALNTLSSFLSTLRQLDSIEAERDRWQRPAEVIQALELKEGDTVADVGSGAGYFALKLSTAVGSRGKVFAVDVRKLSLLFLWVRGIRRSPRNIEIIVGGEDDPRLPPGVIDAMLIANTYHEFRSPHAMVEHAFRVLRPGGRLVIVDRGPRQSTAETTRQSEHGHDLPLQTVENQLRQQKFEIVGRDGSFIDRPGDDLWWLLIARKP